MKDVNSNTTIVPSSQRNGRLFLAVVGLCLAIFHPRALIAQSYLLNEGYEGTGFENSGWSVFSSANPDYSAAPLVGAQSLRCNGTSSFTQRSFAWSSDFYAYFQVRWLAYAPFKFVVDWIDSNDASISRVVTDGFPNRLNIVHGTSSVSGTTVINTDTTYHVWVEWTRGTGNNGTMKLFVSTTGVKPASPEASIVNGTGNSAIAKLDVGPFDGAGTTDVIYDRILIDDQPIGSNPGGNSPPTITSIPNQITPVSTAIGPISFTVDDAETNANNLTLTGTSSNTSVVPNENIVFSGNGSNRRVTITPAAGVTANTLITITVSDGYGTASTVFNLAVGNANTPTISAIANQSTALNTPVGPIAFTIGDVETPAASLTLLGSSTNTTLVPNGNVSFGGSGSNRTITVTPVTGQSGVTRITVFVSDGQLTNSTSFTVTVAGNTPPTISSVGNQSTAVNTPVGPITFTVGDAETSAASLVVTGESSNVSLVPNGNIALGGTGANRNVTITPASGQSGSTTITLTVSDGQVTASSSFTLTVITGNAPPTISSIADQTMNQDTTLGPISFTVGDAETPAASLSVTGTSSDPSLVPVSGINLGGSGANRTVTITPAAGQAGMVTITLTVSDGELTASDAFVVVISQPDGNPDAWLLREGFEGPGYENSGWTTSSGAPDPDYTTVALKDSQSLNLANGSVLTRMFHPTNDFYLYCRLRWNAFALYHPVFYWSRGDGNTVASLFTDFGDHLQVNHGTVSSTGSTAIEPDVTYHAWIEWTKGTGNDGTMKLFLATNGNKPASPEASLTTGNGGSIMSMSIGSGVFGPDLIVDSILIADDPIGGNPDSATPPTISDIPDQTIDEDSSTGAISFTIGDAETDPNSLIVSATSSNQALVPDGNIALGGSGSSRTITVTPAANQSGSAVITVTVSDGALSASDVSTVTVNPVNDAPVVTLPTGSASYTEDAPPVLLDASATIADIDSPDFNGGNLTVDFAANGSPADRLSVRHQGTGAGEIGVSGTDVSYGGVTIGSFTGGTSGSAPLVVSLNANATPQAAQALLRNITYQNVSEIPSTLPRTVRVTANDGDGGTSAPATMTVTVTAVPDNPVLTWANPAPIVYGTALGAGQLNATAEVPGTFVYTPAAGTVLNVGSGQTLSVTFTPDDAVNYNSTSASVTISVTTASLVVTANNTNRAYGETNPLFSATISGFVNGDNETALTGTLAFSTLAETNSPVGQYAITPSGLSSPNYALSFVDGTLTITPYALIATADSASKLYGAALPALTGTLVGMRNGDAITATFTTAATAASNAGLYPITPVLVDPDNLQTNYTVTLINGTLTNLPAPLTISARNTNRLYGAVNPAFTATYVGFVNGDDETGLDSPVSLTTTANAASPVASYSITASGAADVNYVITHVDGTLTVNPAPLTITANNASRAYAMTNPLFSATISGFVNGDDETDLTGTLAFSTLAETNSPVGVYPITASGVSSANYALSFVDGILTITPYALVVTADNTSKLYGAELPALTGTLAGVHNGDAITATFTTTATAASNAGLYPITPVLVDPDNLRTNYTVTLINGTLTNLPAALTISARNTNRLYGAANPAFTAIYVGFVNGDDETALDSPVSLTTTANAASPVASYSITASGAADANYVITHVDGTLTVNAAALTVTANNTNRAYGETNPLFSATISGFVNGDDEGDLTGALAFTTPAETNSPVGAYPITPSGVTSPNYTLSFVDGVLTITPYALVVTADNTSKLYGAALPALTGTLVGVHNGDAITATFTTTATAASNAGLYPITPVLVDPDNLQTNYTVTLINGTLTNLPAPLTITANKTNRAYGETNPLFSATISGFVNGDDESALTGALAFSTLAETNSPVGQYAITASGLSSPNYALSFVDGTLTITPYALIATADSASKLYGAALPALTGTLVGMRNGDAITATFTTTATAASNAGLYPITPVLVDPDNLQTNYTVTLINGTLTNLPAPLAISADNKTKPYGAVLPTLTGSLTGVQNGDNITAAYSTSATAASAVGSYDILPSLVDPDGRLSNYTVTSSNGTLTVTPATPPTIAVVSINPAGEATLRITSDPGERVKVQASTDLNTWAEVTTLFNATGTVDYLDTAAAGQPYRFYRAVLAPE